MSKAIFSIFLSIFVCLFTSCSSDKVDYTLIRPEYQEYIATGIENRKKLNQSTSTECTHQYEEYGIQTPVMRQYNEEQHCICCPLCNDVLEYVSHSEHIHTNVESGIHLSDGTPCHIKFLICECGSFFKAILYRGSGDEIQ